MKTSYTVVCGRRYPEGDLNIKYTAPAGTFEEAIDLIDNLGNAYPVELIEVRWGDYVWTIDTTAGEYRPLVS